MRDEWEKPLREQGCIRMVEGVPGIEIQQKYNSRNTETQKYNRNTTAEIQKYRNTEIQQQKYRNTETQKYNSSGRAGLHTDGGRCADNRNTCISFIFCREKEIQMETLYVYIFLFILCKVYLFHLFSLVLFSIVFGDF